MASIMSITGLFMTLSLLLRPAATHSWPEYINAIDDTGALAGPNGYPRNWARRTDPGWNDNWFTNRIIQVNESVMACPAHQMARGQTSGLPRLQTAPGGMVAIRYLENGHVTQPQIPPGKPDHSGTVYIYGSQEVAPKLLDMLEWTADGKGGDGKGKLLIAQPFDDGRCYQVNPRSPIYNQRTVEYDNHKTELPCQVDFAVPTDITVGQPYSIIWYWNWTTVADNANMQDQELYTSCMDIDIQNAANATSKSQSQGASFNASLPIASQAIPAYFNQLVGQQLASPTAAAPAPSAAASPDPVSSVIGALQSAVPAGVPLEESPQGGAVIVPSSAEAALATPIVTTMVTTMIVTMITTMPAAATVSAVASMAAGDSRPTVLPLTASLPSIMTAMPQSSTVMLASSSAMPGSNSTVSLAMQTVQATGSSQPRPANPTGAGCSNKRGLGTRSRLFAAAIDEMARREAEGERRHR